MNFKNILVILILILLSSLVFSSTFNDFNINYDAPYTNSTSVTLYYSITADDPSTCQVCFSENSDNNICSARENCDSVSKSFILSSTDERKTVYAFIYDDGNFTESDEKDDITLDTTPPICQITSPTTDVNTSSVIFEFNCDGADTTLARIDSNIITDGLNLSTFLTTQNSNYIIAVDANDAAGNQAQQKTLTFKYDVNAPIGGSTPISTNRYTNSTKPTFTFSATDNGTTMNAGNIALSCVKDVSKRKVVNFATTYNDFNILDTTYGCNSTVNQDKNIYVWFIDKAWNYSIDYNTVIGYDTTNPSTPTNLDSEKGDREIKLTWTAPSADNFSGNKSYKIYKNNSSSELATVTSTNYTATGLTNGTQYCFKVSTIDNAGNESGKTSEVCETPQDIDVSISIKRNDSETDYVKPDDNIEITCVFSENVTNAKINAKYNSTPTQTLKSTSSATKTISEELNINGNYTQLQIWCESTQVDSSNKYLTIDNQSPTIEWSDSNNDCSLTKKLMVKATDNKGINKVEFIINSVTYQTTKIDNNYYYDFNTKTLENGDYTLKAIAYDRADNKKEITKKITINNILTEQQICEKLIKEGKEKKKMIEDMIKYLQEQGIIIDSNLQDKKKNADNQLSYAETDIRIDINQAKQKAEQAKILYQELSAELTSETKDALVFEKKDGTTKATMQSMGFNENVAAQAEENSKKNERKLKIIQLGGAQQAVIELTIHNDTQSETIKVIEIIPKELINSAKEVYSDINFNILQDDPIIEFVLTIPIGQTKTISYGVGKINETTAKNLIENNIMNNYSSSPIVVTSEIETKKVVEENNTQQFIIFIGIIVIVLIIIAGIIVVGTIFLKQSQGFGGEKTNTEVKKEETETKKQESWPNNQ